MDRSGFDAAASEKFHRPQEIAQTIRLSAIVISLHDDTASRAPRAMNSLNFHGAKKLLGANLAARLL